MLQHGQWVKLYSVLLVLLEFFLVHLDVDVLVFVDHAHHLEAALQHQDRSLSLRVEQRHVRVEEIIRVHLIELLFEVVVDPQQVDS